MAEQDFIFALRGPDQELPQEIQPIGWLKTMIEECRHIARTGDEIEDKEAFYDMISEVEWLYQKSVEALAKTSVRQSQ